MTDYVPPATTAAERVRLAEAEADAEAQRRWFEQVASEQLERFLYDKTEPTAIRQNAMAVLLERLRKSRDFLAGTAALLEPLIDDPDVEVARTAIRHYPLSGEDALVRVRPLLDSPDGQVRAEAAVALARIGDAGVPERLFAWFNSDQEADRNSAIEGLVALNSADARQTLAEAWELRGRGRGDRVTLSVA